MWRLRLRGLERINGKCKLLSRFDPTCFGGREFRGLPNTLDPSFLWAEQFLFGLGTETAGNSLHDFVCPCECSDAIRYSRVKRRNYRHLCCNTNWVGTSKANTRESWHLLLNYKVIGKASPIAGGEYRSVSVKVKSL